ncbi:MAG: phosphoribosylamine--glycine ligase, partial [Alphaproteobacteria bacterium]|nr:phosphoribosylamine--glycine ligase [Alphaproteobacteria bacterium]
MNILLIGGGAREHALAWRLRQSPSCDLLIAVPGNPGIAQEAECVACDVKDHAAIMAICTERSIDLVVIGPEAPLIDGLADSLRAGGIAVFGPGAKAAQLEGSKGFTKDMCAAMKIPTAAYARFDSAGSALAAVGRFGLPVVIKADGLAAGKGVIIAQTKDEANAAIRMMFDGHFGKAGAAIVIEEFLNGEEVSFFAICDGTHAIPFGAAQDHKRVGDGDTGPNTGGMGAYSPTKLFTKSIQSVVFRDIIRPTLEYMSRCGVPFTGVLFAGLMLTAEGPKLIEYNTRFGDPECQVLMMRFEGDLAALLYAAATGALASQPPVRLRDDTALTVVLAARG